MTDKDIWDQEIGVPEDVIKFVDANVLAGMCRLRSSNHLLSHRDLAANSNCLMQSLELPKGTKVQSIRPHGASYWTRTAEIQTVQGDGDPLSFFLKVTSISIKYSLNAFCWLMLS